MDKDTMLKYGALAAVIVAAVVLAASPKSPPAPPEEIDTAPVRTGNRRRKAKTPNASVASGTSFDPSTSASTHSQTDNAVSSGANDPPEPDPTA